MGEPDQKRKKITKLLVIAGSLTEPAPADTKGSAPSLITLVEDSNYYPPQGDFEPGEIMFMLYMKTFIYIPNLAISTRYKRVYIKLIGN
jgi:hypothetical protein